MKIAFYIESPAYFWMANAAIASARRHMPNAQVVQLSPQGLSILDNVDEVIRRNQPGKSFLGRYFGLASEVEGDMVLANTDVLFHGDVSSVFNGSYFDVAAPHIASPTVDYDGAFIFTRNQFPIAQVFWHRLLAEPACWGTERSVDEQLAAINRALISVQGLGVLPGDVYSYVPRSPWDFGALGAKAIHYRGPRKHWMAEACGMTPAAASDWLLAREQTHPGLTPKA